MSSVYRAERIVPAGLQAAVKLLRGGDIAIRFERRQLGYGSAVAVIAFLISFAIAVAYQRFVLRRDVAGALTSIGR